MLIKLISMFLAVQFVSFALWLGLHSSTKKTVQAAAEERVQIHHEAAQTTQPTQTGHVRFASRSADNNYFVMDAVKQQEITEVLGKLPAGHTSTLKNIVLDYNPKAHRGLGGQNLIILRAVNMGQNEFVGVLIHEIGHNVDLGHMSETDQTEKSEFMDGKRPVYQSDPSLGFYRISWKNDTTRKRSATNLDFVSGYAMTDPFEDFAESYVYYVLHNQEFKSKAQTSDKLLAKYNFLKYTVFDGKEFETGELLTDNLNNRPWDITLLSYDLTKFLNV